MSDLEEAKRVLQIEAKAVLNLIDQLNDNFVSAVDLIAECQGKVVVAGMGKSGHIGKKLAATMSSTGTSAVFLHPAEGSHGDLGILKTGDILLVLSYGGGSQELTHLLDYASRNKIEIIAMTGKLESLLAKRSNLLISVAIEEEACPLGLAPTSSSTATLAMGDALAMAVLKRKGFREEDFAEFHPGGRLGRRLLTRVRDLMYSGDAVPRVVQGALMLDVVKVMTGSEVRGIAAVVNTQGGLVGVVTDGDIRRHLEKNKNPLDCQVDDLMSLQPKVIDASELAIKSLFLMEQFRINSLFVVETLDGETQLIGILHLQDLIQAKLD